MSAEEDRNQFDQPELAYQDLKIGCVNTALFTKDKQITLSPHKLQHLSSNQTETSFENCIHQENVQQLSQASITYLRECCLLQEYDLKQGFRNQKLFKDFPFEIQGISDLQHLTTENELLSLKEKEQWMTFLREYTDVQSMLKLIIPAFGITVGKEIAYVFYHLLRLKLQAYKTFISLKQEIIPKFNCFIDFSEEIVDSGMSSPVYEELNAQEIIQFAQKGLQQFNNTIYFAKEIKFLNLKTLLIETKANILSKLYIFNEQLSKTLFLTIAGIRQSSNIGSGMFSVSFSREESFTSVDVWQNLLLGVQKSSSRLFSSHESQQKDTLCKKMKL